MLHWLRLAGFNPLRLFQNPGGLKQHDKYSSFKNTTA